MDEIEIAAEVAKRLGVEVLGNAVCTHEPECGALEVDTDQDITHNETWQAKKMWPVYVGGCICDLDGTEDDVQLFGHSVYCLRPVPEPYSDTIILACMNKLVYKYGWDQVGNEIHKMQKLDETNEHAIIRKFLKEF